MKLSRHDIYPYLMHIALMVLNRFDFLAFHGLEETTGATTDVVDEDDAVQQAVMDWSSWCDPELTNLKAVGN